MPSCKETATTDASATTNKTPSTKLKFVKRAAYLGCSAYAFLLCMLPPLTTIICDPGSPWGH